MHFCENFNNNNKKKNGSRFIVKSMQIKNICDVVELHKNPRNPFQKRIVIP